MSPAQPGRTGVTAAAGFEAAGVKGGLRSDGREDVALVRNLGPEFSAAGVFTSNRVFAAPVGWSRAAVADGRLVAVILNSGGANACTGDPGRQDTADTAAAVASTLDCGTTDVAVCSTGLIGVRLPMDKLLGAVPSAVEALSNEGGAAAAGAIMTTDTVSKQASVTTDAGWTVGGMAKGAGMLAPALATMLVVITTDAAVDPVELHSALKQATHVTFDRADSDGCMSTNDTVLLLANGASGITPSQADFTAALTEVCRSLAVQLIADAEGAEHEVAIEVTSAATEDDAVEVARAVARSNLFKCAIAGNDPNWGRVLAAVGTTQAAFEPERLDVSFNGVPVYVQGGLGADRSEVDLKPRQVHVQIALNAGDQSATVWTNDLTHGYVSENADYPT
ncbi:MAG TPA: bifunctional glutamate N-acetyltransferase/amino-acid acetyltransferase ArgJ [Propionibacteriaceae bacterium]|nr:bifunctional glutamate N-acetyltransferase/amino-acid acetyltransferase ArgJ [Propionibacteriaceae bacterium]